MAARETHKARKEWFRWSATPEDMAEVARTAEQLVARNAPVPELSIKLDSPAWESEFVDVNAFLEGLRPGDLADVKQIEIHASAGGCSIVVTIKRSKSTLLAGEHDPSRLEPVVRLYIAGPDREWVAEAESVMKGVVARTRPSDRPIRATLLAGVALVALGVVLLVTGSYGTTGERTLVELVGAILLITGLALMALTVLSGALLIPLLDLREAGQRSRRETLAQWSGREGEWLVRTFVAALIGAGVTLLIVHLT
jgi:hypothetical protein